jgi:hypothetical protein
MVFGGVVHERLQLNEDTLWAGGRMISGWRFHQSVFCGEFVGLVEAPGVSDLPCASMNNAPGWLEAPGTARQLIESVE